ncbi:MAG: hypothetical protein HQ523_05800 [Lentisphaerae bacterium]|nr:hypothetical protein [Lentisphaerota bacterium]
MRDQNREDDVPSFSLQSLLQLIRAAGALLGVIAIIIGLVYATRIFGLVFDALLEPEVCQAHLDKWAVAVGGDELNIVIGGTTYHLARTMALLVLGGGVTILAWISMGLVQGGAKTVSWILSDREAVKKILIHAFGSAKKPERDRSVGGGDK